MQKEEDKSAENNHHDKYLESSSNTVNALHFNMSFVIPIANFEHILKTEMKRLSDSANRSHVIDSFYTQFQKMISKLVQILDNFVNHTPAIRKSFKICLILHILSKLCQDYFLSKASKLLDTMNQSISHQLVLRLKVDDVGEDDNYDDDDKKLIGECKLFLLLIEFSSRIILTVGLFCLKSSHDDDDKGQFSSEWDKIREKLFEIQVVIQQTDMVPKSTSGSLSQSQEASDNNPVYVIMTEVSLLNQITIAQMILSKICKQRFVIESKLFSTAVWIDLWESLDITQVFFKQYSQPQQSREQIKIQQQDLKQLEKKVKILKRSESMQNIQKSRKSNYQKIKQRQNVNQQSDQVSQQTKIQYSKSALIINQSQSSSQISNMRDCMSQKLFNRLQTIAPVGQKGRKKQKQTSKSKEFAYKIKQEAKQKIRQEQRKTKEAQKAKLQKYRQQKAIKQEKVVLKEDKLQYDVTSPARLSTYIAGNSKRVYELRDTPSREKKSARAYFDKISKL